MLFMFWLLEIFCVFCVICECKGLSFFLKENEEKCFIQELPNETLLVGRYRCFIPNKERDDYYMHELGVMVNIKDPKDHVVMSKLYRFEGLFTYKSHVPGIHTVCMHPKTSYPSNDKLRIYFDLQVGEHAMNHSSYKQRLHLTDLEARYQQLLEKAIDVHQELDYLRYREELYRGTTETISRRVLLWMVAETVLLIVVGVWQVEKLRRFFNSKKLV